MIREIGNILYKVEIIIFLMVAVCMFFISYYQHNPLTWNYIGAHYKENESISYADALGSLYDASTPVDKPDLSGDGYSYYGQFTFYDNDYMKVNFYYLNGSCYLRWYVQRELGQLREANCGDVHLILEIDESYMYDETDHN